MFRLAGMPEVGRRLPCSRNTDRSQQLCQLAHLVAPLLPLFTAATRSSSCARATA